MTARPAYLPELLDRKFGSHRGRNTRACKALGVQSSNLSAALGGASTLSQKHIDALKALPDYSPPIGVVETIEDIGGGNYYRATTFTVPLDAAMARSLDYLARACSGPSYASPDFEANPEATKKFFRNMMSAFHLSLSKKYSGDLANARIAIEREKDEARAELRKELNERKHLVADELTENEIYADAGGVYMSEDHADEDPLT